MIIMLTRRLTYSIQGLYIKWTTANNFESKLPKDVQAAAEKKKNSEQKQIDRYLREQPKKEKPIKYSHDVFKRAVISWLVATDQV